MPEGHRKHDRSLIEPGTVFGRLTVLEFLGSRNGTRWYACRCECGQETEARGTGLRRGEPQSCGCLRLDRLSAAKRRHGMSYPPTRTYVSWHQARQRCRNPNNPRYADWGGRGITVCERWDLFENFLADMGERPEGTTLDRIDNDGNYEPGNCRWATMSEQRTNSRPRGSGR